jgi:predicted nucleic acid-binding protein
MAPGLNQGREAWNGLLHLVAGHQRNNLPASGEGVPAALTFLERVRRNEEVQIVHPDPALQAEAWDLFGRWGSAGANAVDCVSFAMMARLGIREAFTFDAHFREAGFDTLGAHSQHR